MPRRPNKNVGIIGLGIIGSRVRETLRAKGFRVFVWNRTPKPVPNFVGAPVELAEMCDVIQIFVSDDDALIDVVKQLAPGIGARHVIVAHPTVAPHTMVSASEIVQRRGARFVEAPFTGSKEAAENGQLVYYVSGDEAAVAEARPALQASSKDVMFIGEIGTATLMKITTNMVTAASVQAAAEAMALVRASGLSIEKFVEAMKSNASNSKTLDLKLPKMLTGDFEPHFSVKHMLKDMQIASRLGLSHHLELGVTSAARDRLLEQMQRGFGDEDYSAVARKYFTGATSDSTEEGLELFGMPPPTNVEGQWVAWTPGDQAPEVVHAVARPDEPKPDVDLAQNAPASAPNEFTQPEQPTNVVEEESEERRGFFGRLLRRES
jgi:3-hydroxyisobutyrate dehydrogenase-like beta-hydroxyacid dehydrogenase